MSKISVSSLVKYCLPVIMGSLLTACGQGGKDVSTTPVEPAPVEVVEPSLTMEEFSDQLRANGGGVVFTDCPADDGSRWDGTDDPFGVLVCGAEYEVSYDQTLGEWTATGPKEREGVAADALPRMTHSYAGKDPREGLMVVWGGVYRFDEKGRVYSARRGEQSVGRLTLAGM